MNVVLGLAIALGGVVGWLCLWMSAAVDARDFPVPRMLAMEARAARYAVLAMAVAGVGVGLRAVADHLARRASMPRPAPVVDPLAHYREGPLVGCARHPFAD